LEYDTKAGIAIISIGSDSGIKVGSQLEVYRLKPNPKYLGKIEILQVQENRAVGRFPDDAPRGGPLEKGDRVASKVMGKADSTAHHQANEDWPDWADKKVKFEMRDKPWSQVFEWLSDQTGLPVIMSNESKPTGTFTYVPRKNSPKEYTIPQVIDILNQSLDQQNYLLVRRGENLFVISTAIANPLGIGGDKEAAWASSLFDAKKVEFGTVPRGEQIHHMWRITNTLKEPIHIASLRVSATFVTAKALVKFDDQQGELMVRSNAWIAPHQSIYVYVQVDTGRFSGEKTFAVYVQFDQPSSATVQLQLHANSKDSPTGADSQPEPPRDPKAKMNELEHEIHQLMMEIDDLRDQLKQPAKPGSNSSRSEEVPGTKIQRYIQRADEATPAKQ
jgi:hypothetical protein